VGTNTLFTHYIFIYIRRTKHFQLFAIYWPHPHYSPITSSSTLEELNTSSFSLFIDHIIAIHPSHHLSAWRNKKFSIIHSLHPHDLVHFTACSFRWWLMAGADLL
jgi:hypothetical protein